MVNGVTDVCTLGNYETASNALAAYQWSLTCLFELVFDHNTMEASLG
jgi:hypothetical protein